MLVPQRAFGALKSWPAERSLLRQSAEALWEAITVQGPQHLRRGVSFDRSSVVEEVDGVFYQLFF